MNLICGKHESPTMQCIVIEDGKQCIHGVRNKKRGLCSKHYARWQRSGSPHLLLPNGGSLTKAEQQNILRARQARLVSEGLSTICICSHKFMEHGRNGCNRNMCRCKKFEGTNELMFIETIDKIRTIGFKEPLNDAMRCCFCYQFIRVGRWYDPLSIGRMREHLRLNHLSSRNRRAG